MVIAFIPTSSGIGPVDQFAVPFAVPDPPTEFIQVIDAKPALSCAVPLTTSVELLVASVVLAGERIVKVGGAPGLGFGGRGGASARVTVNDVPAVAPPSE